MTRTFGAVHQCVIMQRADKKKKNLLFFLSKSTRDLSFVAIPFDLQLNTLKCIKINIYV